MYEKFAAVYDSLMYDTDYKTWSDKIINIIKERCPAAKKGLDLACGSGNFTIPLAKAGYLMTAADISQEMLNAAKNKTGSKGIQYICRSINDIAINGKVDFITVMCDGINYVTDAPDFARLYDLLTDGGLLIFDISTKYKIKHVLDGNVFYDDSDEITYFWSNEYNAKTKILDMDLVFFLKNGDMYEKFNENHKFRCYELDELKRMLGGFEVEILNGHCAKELKDDDLRIHFICQKR